VRLIGGHGDADVANPRIIHAVDRRGDAEMIEDLGGGFRAVVEGEGVRYRPSYACQMAISSVYCAGSKQMYRSRSRV
jgi:hypothetical protein